MHNTCLCVFIWDYVNQSSAILTGPQRIKRKPHQCCENDLWLFLSFIRISLATWKCKFVVWFLFFFIGMCWMRERANAQENQPVKCICIRHWRTKPHYVISQCYQRAASTYTYRRYQLLQQITKVGSGREPIGTVCVRERERLLCIFLLLWRCVSIYMLYSLHLLL